MHDPVLVGVAETREDLADERQDQPRVRTDASFEGVLEVDPLEQLQHHEGRALVLAELVDHDDVGVLQPRRGPGLAQEARARAVVGPALRHHLDRDFALEVVVAPAIDGPHRAASQFAEDAVASDALGSRHGSNDILPAVRAVIQRVSEASVRVAGDPVAAIGRGLVVLLGVGKDDAEADVAYLAEKILNLRVFADETGQMNRSVLDVGGGLLVVSQFTLFGDARRGRRPSYSEAAGPEQANRLYESLVERLRASGRPVATGIFRAMMDVGLVNDGPVTILLDSRRVF